MLGLSLLAAVIAYVAGIGAARRLGAKLASFIGMAEVLFAIAFAWLLLGQLPSVVQFLGGAFILAGVALVRSDELKSSPAEEPPDSPARVPELARLRRTVEGKQAQQPVMTSALMRVARPRRVRHRPVHPASRESRDRRGTPEGTAGCDRGRGHARDRRAGGLLAPERVTGGPSGTYLVPSGIHKIKHVIIIMQENRSFDSYFGTYPGADGIPMRGTAVDGVRAEPGPLGAPGPTMTRPTSTAAARTARPRWPTSTTARWTGSSRSATRPGTSAPWSQPGLQRTPARPTSWATTPPRRYRTTGVRQGLRPPRPHVRAGEVVVASGAPLPGLRLVGEVSHRSPMSCVNDIVGPYGATSS